MKRDAAGQPDSSSEATTSAAAKRATLSEVIMAFAAPLLELDASAASEVDVLSQLMVLVDMCWNLPILQRTDPSAHAKLKQGFDAVLQEVPGPVAQQLNQLLVDRTTRFGALAFLIHTRVEDDGHAKARILVEARKPQV